MKKRKKKVVLGPVVPMKSGQFVGSSPVSGPPPTTEGPQVWTKTMDVEIHREFVSNGKFTPEEKRVWLQAATNMVIMLSTETMEQVARAKARYADEMLKHYRAKFLVPQYKIDSKFQDKAAMIMKALESPVGIKWTLGDPNKTGAK